MFRSRRGGRGQARSEQAKSGQAKSSPTRLDQVGQSHVKSSQILWSCKVRPGQDKPSQARSSSHAMGHAKSCMTSNKARGKTPGTIRYIGVPLLGMPGPGWRGRNEMLHPCNEVAEVCIRSSVKRDVADAIPTRRFRAWPTLLRQVGVECALPPPCTRFAGLCLNGQRI